MSDRGYAFRAFGATIHSNVELRGLLPATDHARRITIHVAPPVDQTAAGKDAPSFVAGMERMWRLRDGWLLRYAAPGSHESWTMRVTGGGARVDVARTPGVVLEDLLQVVQSVGLASALQLQGVLLLHGCAIEVEGRAVLVLGPAGSGKSTVAAASIRQGFRLISDDVSAIDAATNALLVHPGPARLRITPQSARALAWDPNPLPRVFTTDLLDDKRQLQLSVEGGSFCPAARQIEAIFILGARGIGGKPTITRAPPGQALGLLRANGYRDALLDRAEHAERFPLLTRLAREIPIHTVEAPDDLESLPELVESIIALANDRATKAYREPRRQAQGRPSF